MSPELIRNNPGTQADDYWALAILICFMATRKLIFDRKCLLLTEESILRNNYDFSILASSEPLLVDLVRGLLQNRERRVTFARNILSHRYFT